LHFLPLIGYKGFVSYQKVLQRAVDDFNSLQDGGVDAIIVENNYNFPHRIKETPEVIEMIRKLIKELKKISSVPIGISVLFNDFENALKIAKESGAEFIRVPVFVDNVKTIFGEIKGNPDKVIEFRKKIEAENIKILTDIQVKHSKLINKRPIREAALEAREKGSNGLIITGTVTGEAPLIKDLQEVKAISGDIPVIIGSGADKTNIKRLFKFADAVIVSTSLKEGEKDKNERNAKSYNAKMDLSKVRSFVGGVK